LHGCKTPPLYLREERVGYFRKWYCGKYLDCMEKRRKTNLSKEKIP